MKILYLKIPFIYWLLFDCTVGYQLFQKLVSHVISHKTPVSHAKYVSKGNTIIGLKVWVFFFP